MRNMSFFLTTQQFLDGTKDVTRRLGWAKLEEGTHLMGIEKGQGIKKGGLKRLEEIEIVSNFPEPLDYIITAPYRNVNPWHPERSKSEMQREGFPNLTSRQFVEMFCREMSTKKRPVTPGTIVNRIEFARVVA